MNERIKHIQGRFFIHRATRWKLQRILRYQVGWDRARHRPIDKWEVTFSNGAFLRYSQSKYLVKALWRARFYDNDRE